MSFIFPSSIQYRRETKENALAELIPVPQKQQQQFSLNKCAQYKSLLEKRPSNYSNIPKDGSCWEQSSSGPKK